MQLVRGNLAQAHNHMDLTDKIAIVIGAAGRDNMGQTIANRLVEEGVKVVVAGRHEDELKRFASAIDGHHFICDITDRNAMDQLVTTTIDKFGGLDIAINATGWGLTKQFLKTTEDELDKMLSLQFKGPFFFMQAVIPAMKTVGGGSLIQISSATAVLATEHHAAYAGTKAGIDHVIRTLANEYGKDGIRINSVSPGLTKTPMTKDAVAIPGLVDAFVDEYPLNRIGTSEDVAAMVAFLSSDECFMTGQNLQVNGGLTLRRNPRPNEIAQSIETAKNA